MAYKQEYRPLQVYSQEQWLEVEPGEALRIPGISGATIPASGIK
jgi:hypothetical protein